MKRCPQCEFIYPDADAVCDFDQTPLVAATESEIAAITNTPARPALSDLAATHSKNFESRRARKTLPFAAIIGLLLGVAVFVAYFAVRRQMRPSSNTQQVVANTPTQVQQSTPSVVESPSPDAVESPSPTELQSGQSKASPAKTTTAHTTTSTSTGPVSTGSPAAKPKSGTKPVILLTTGGRVEADEVWRTKDGVWYRRDGVVTLLKKNRVKAIINQ